ncbi:MAG: glutamine amidotransferase [Candidatus Firestonebacteria bacterium]
MITFEFTYWAVFFLVAGGLAGYSLLKYGDKRKKIISALRISIFLLLVFLLLKPALLQQKKRTEKAAISILADVSRSMDLKGAYHKFSRVKNIIKKDIEPLEKSYTVNYYAFSSGFSRVSKDDLFKLDKPSGEFTDIGQSLEQIREEIHRNSSVSGSAVILISDGNHNGGLDPVEASKSLNLPLYVIGVGEPRSGFDVELSQVLSSEIAFRNIKSVFKGVINSFNSKGKTVRVTLKKDGAFVAAQDIVLKSDGEESVVSFEYLHEDNGIIKFEMLVDAGSGELNKANNKKEFSVNVLKEKTRILYISGSPNYEYRFLRQVMKNNPNYEVVTFIILRGMADLVPLGELEYTLIPFPVQEIFTKEIYNYDIVILENFSYKFYMPSEFLNSIKTFVEKSGGAFMMIGGPDSFGGGGYKGTMVEEMLPVNIKPEGAEEYIKTPFRLKPAKHPVNQLSEIKGENEAIWQSLPELSGLNRFASQKSGSVVLAEHPDLKGDDGRPLPVIAGWQKGKGRVLATGLNNTWRWSMWLAGTGRGNYHYGRYWQQMFNWLVNAPDLRRVSASAERKVYRQGDEVKINVTVLDDYFHYEDEAAVNLDILDPNGKLSAIRGLSNIGNGVYEVSFPAESPGNYKLTASAFKGSKNMGTVSFFVPVQAVTSEDYDLFLNDKILKGVAASSGGRYFEGGCPGLDKMIKINSSESVLKEKTPVWDNPLFFILIIILLAVEWFLRRISGLL